MLSSTITTATLVQIAWGGAHRRPVHCAISVEAWHRGALQVGTAALAYAAHKAASPIRFPPTVALTPLVARWMGKEVKEGDD